MRIKVGDEIRYAQSRLNDIIYLAEKTDPVDKSDWEDYTRSIRNLIAEEARKAITVLSVLL